jgi:hypothetical protein
LLISIVCVVVLGGLLDGLLYLVAPAGLSNWAYIVLKTFYTGATGALAVVFAVWSIVSEENRSAA